MKNRIFSKLKQAFTMTNNMASSGLWENVTLTNITLFTDCPMGCAKSDMWWQIVWHLIGGSGPHTYQCCMGLTQAMQTPTPLKEGMWAKCSGHL